MHKQDGQQDIGSQSNDYQDSELEALLTNGQGNISASDCTSAAAAPEYSWLTYTIFLLLGVSMLWAWNMFLAAAPYFQQRFAKSPRLLSAYPPTLLSVSTITNLVAMIILTYRQKTAHYPRRIMLALLINLITFILLGMSTSVTNFVSETSYFIFLMSMVLLASLAAGLCQNGVFAFVASWPSLTSPKYTQAVMTGQAIAGVLPCLAQIVSVLSVESPSSQKDSDQGSDADESAKAALAYFGTAVFMSLASLIAFSFLLRQVRISTIRQQSSTVATGPDLGKVEQAVTSIPLLYLYRRLHWLANAVFVTFTLTMFYPVFTQQIESTMQPPIPQLLRPASFIPLAFLIWNCGDLAGRLLTMAPRVARLTKRPRLVFALSMVRISWIALYLMCNLRSRFTAVPSRLILNDAIYLAVVQFGFGLGNGLVGSLCMMGSADAMGDEDGDHGREAAGGFMGLMLVGGLTAGSILSFLVA